MLKKITLITSSHLSSNPRLVKEAKALLEAGYMLEILCAQHLSNLIEFDEKIFSELEPAVIKVIDYQKNWLKPSFLRFNSTLRLKVAKSTWSNLFANLKWVEQSRMLPEMRKALKNSKSDLYIAHTLAALPAAGWAAKFHDAKYAFDAEDYHLGEHTSETDQQAVKLLEDHFLPSCTYLSTASPIATKLYQERYPKLQILTLNNFFSCSSEIPIQPKGNKLIKIVWFSQTIGLNRGLQDFLKALTNLNPHDYELHIRGSHDETIKNELLSQLSMNWKSNIFFYQQCAPSYLQNWLTQFDIGLALENKETLNRDICITNKIFQYITSGLAIIATDTEGQKWVLNQAPEIGIIAAQDKMEIAATQLKTWSENPAQLKMAKQKSKEAAQNIFNWDLEKQKLIEQISSLNYSQVNGENG